MNITSNIFPRVKTDHKERQRDDQNYAVELAQFHNWLGLSNKGISLLAGIQEQGAFIRKSYSLINTYYYKTEDVIPAAEWYLDNYYLVNELTNELLADLSKKFESKLKYLAGGDAAGLPRVSLLVSEFVKSNKNEINTDDLIRFIENYQLESPLSSAEIWAIPIMLKVILLEKIFYQVERIVYIQKERENADSWLNSILGQSNKELDLSEKELDISKSFSSVYIERVARRLKEYGTDAKVLLNWLDNVADKQNMTVEKIINTELCYLTSHGVLMGNIIAAIKMINSENWSSFFEGVSLVQKALESDPAKIFKQMDFESRDKYRHEIEALAVKYNVSELTVAKTLETLASNNAEAPYNHVGYYLLGSGRIELERDLARNWGRVRQKFHSLSCLIKENPTWSYLSFILAATLIPFSGFLWLGREAVSNASLGAILLAGASTFIITNGLAVFTVNRVICQALPPSFLPKLDLSQGIPDEYKAIVVIPAIFSNSEKVREQVEQLEVHYLNNQDPNLYFALLGDFTDAPEKTMSGDVSIIQEGIKRIKKLNKKYQSRRFLYLHRDRQWNDREKMWMGWERKRGKLIELNKLLLNDGETSYSVHTGPINDLKNVHYVITLDADTILPRDSAQRLIGTIAHPMQKAKMDNDQKKVLSGYGIIQPRIGLTAASAYATPFSKTSTGIAGIDPYTCAISDIYQDLFGEGIFTGKGIYDIKVFHAMTKDAFQENSILSHDLIEGLHARTALATDIQLFDAYPTKYLAFTKRTHRWIRGDWQIARYIFDRSLSVVSRWKIIDNLRRSLEAPLLFLLLYLSFTSMASAFWLLFGLFLLALTLPLILNILGAVLDRSLTMRILKFELGLGLFQILFSIVVLPYQAYIQLDAVVRSVYRQVFSQRLLLEWEPAADSEKKLCLNSKNFYLTMYKGILMSLLLLMGYFYVSLWQGVILAILLIVWLSSPYIAYRFSIPFAVEPQEIVTADEIELRKWARQIWAFFDLFVNKENNYLPPDNIQLEPYKGEANRTSPTNIGLALLANLAAADLGYISTKNLLTKTENTTKVIKRLPKWNGHIYNWYNTHTLEPLNPIYISTVDSGNLAGYVIAMKNGLADYASKPLADRMMMQGLRDTFRLIDEKELENYPKLLAFGNELQERSKTLKDHDLKSVYLFLDKWLELLHPLNAEISKIKDKNLPAYSFDFWVTAISFMLQDFKDAIETYYPYIAAERIPDTLKGLESLGVKKLARAYISLLQAPEEPLPESSKTYLKQGLKSCLVTLLRLGNLRKNLKSIALDMDFKPLFDHQRRIFSIGYNLTEQRLDKSYYDLLASEARQTSLWAIAKGDVPESHWFKMARPFTRIDGNRSLVSWSGTMFEFLMPLILFKNYRGTLLDETYQSVVKIQQAYAKKADAPWGISESGFFTFDIQNNYQYKAFGVPGLGLKRGLSKDMVISPYSTFMALAVDYTSSIANLKNMKDKGFNGLYGLYEAIDLTSTRVPYNQKFSVVKSYMSHHQGMSFISLNNVLCNNKMQERFHREPLIKSIELLLQEQIPLKEYTFNPMIEEAGEKSVPAITRKKGERPVLYYSPDTKVPRTCFISNREYSVMLTLSGSGYSQFNDIFVSRWRPDPTIDMYGSYIYVQNLNSGAAWATTSKPLGDPGKDYSVTCFPNSVKYSRRDGNIITQTEIFVSPEDPVEIRKVSLTNQSQYSRDIQLTSYTEVILDQLSADVAHPTFSKLFIQTKFQNNTIIALRRPRHQDKQEFYLMHTLFVEGETLGDPEYETDRTKFIGRGRTLANPRAIDINQPLSNSAGAVLDPIMSLRTRVRLNPGKTVHVYYISGVGGSSETVIRLSQKYKSSAAINQAKELSWCQNLMELTNLDLSFDEANMISSLASQVVFPGPARRRISIKNNQLGQSSLWSYGISGDLPIVMLKIQDSSQIKMVEQMLIIHEYWKIKGLFIDLVILNEDKMGYFQGIQDMIQEKIGVSHVRKLVNKLGGVFLLKKDQLSNEILLLLNAVARLIFSGENGSLNNQILKFVKPAEQINAVPVISKYHPLKKIGTKSNHLKHYQGDNIKQVIFFNGYGGFSQDGKEYIIQLDNENTTPLPWVNVIGNPQFGTLLSEAGSSYTWSQNSREYKLSPWSNDPLLDKSGEAIYLRDENAGYYWSPLPQPCQAHSPYTIRHGQGYSVYEHDSNGLKQETTVFIPINESLKIVRLKLINTTQETKMLSVYFYIEWVLGVTREQNAPYLVTQQQDGTILCSNVYQEEFAGRVAFLKSVGGNLKSFTADRKDFIGVNRSMREPAALEQETLSEKIGTGLDPCAAVQVELVIRPEEEKFIHFLIGDEKNKESALDLVNDYSNVKQIKNSYQEVLKFWDDLLSSIQISTPEPTLDLMFNRWLIYQTLVCRIWGRSAFYQSGGAFGYRDQLQDVMSLVLIRPEITRSQIVLHSSRQFSEGDVQHWWHPEKGKGIRTKFSDDLLWLPYVTADYLEHTGDYTVLEEKTPFLYQDLLGEDEDERYAIPVVTDSVATVYEHCVRAIDRGLKFGQHGLPLIGTGDWNDGFSAIGREGRGESVWLGWFIISTLKRFIPICERQGEHERTEKYQKIITDLIENMERNAWDGSWYRRAYYDDGSPLGSVLSPECQIDSLAQSWAVISEGAKESRATDAMLAMERYLWDKEEGIMKLFTPPFEKTDRNPGYIKGYIPGVRENGGQYTQGAIWSILAWTKLGEKEKAMELFNMLNPINHARTSSEVKKYKVEPYVMAADVYAVHPNIGRGGWTWYTGSAGWMYQVALEGILGFTVHGDKLTIKPCVPLSWPGYKVRYRYKSSVYQIEIQFSPDQLLSISVDDQEQKEFPICLIDDRRAHLVKIAMSP